jgi:hypothetical protein
MQLTGGSSAAVALKRRGRLVLRQPPISKQPIDASRLRRVLINRDYSTIAGCRKQLVQVGARSSGAFLPPSPPAEKATACQDQGTSPFGPGGFRLILC